MLFHSMAREIQSLIVDDEIQLFFVQVDNRDLTEDGLNVQYSEDIAVPLNFKDDVLLKRALCGTISKIRAHPQKDTEIVEIYVFMHKDGRSGFYGLPSSIANYMIEHINQAVDTVRENMKVVKYDDTAEIE